MAAGGGCFVDCYVCDLNLFCWCGMVLAGWWLCLWLFCLCFLWVGLLGSWVVGSGLRVSVFVLCYLDVLVNSVGFGSSFVVLCLFT